MALSFTEKHYWKDRISKTVDTKIKNLRKSSAAITDILKIRAEQEVSEKLKISDELEAYESIRKEIEELEAAQKELLSMIAATVYDDEPPYRISFDDIRREINLLITEKADALFAEHQLGQHLQSLEDAKDRLLDSVLLATSVQQIGSLMDKAEALSPFPDLPDEPTEAGSEEEPMLGLSDYSLQ